jgi:tRNA-guanine family transglycosylase
VLFRSYLNGDHIELTPEGSVQAQKDLGADIIIPLDILLPLASAMYAVLHGGVNKHYRYVICRIHIAVLS